MHELTLRVRLKETDALGVVYYSNYFTYLDIARLELLRTLRVTPEYLASVGLQFVAAHASCRYHGSAHFDEIINIQTWISDIGRRSVSYRHKIRREKNNELLVVGEVTDVLVDAEQNPARLPDDLTERLTPAHSLGRD